MLTLQEALWQLARNKGRTLILVLASAMLAGCVAFYLGNIQANEETINQIAEDTPVVVRVANPTGDRDWRLNINAHRYNKLRSSPYLRDVNAAISLVGEYSEEAREKSPFANEKGRGSTDLRPYKGGDCELTALTSFDFLTMSDREVTYIDGYDETMFQSDEAVCLVKPEVAELNDIEVGNEISLPLYSITYDLTQDIIYTPLGEQTIKVVGTYDSIQNPVDFLVPAQWICNVMETQDIGVNYNDAGAFLKDPRQLSVFKESIDDLGFLEPNPDGYMDLTGATIVIRDKDYITSVEPLGQIVVLFRRFQIPFFVMVIGMIILAIFLIMRGSQRDIAISISLGRPKFLCALGCFLAAFTAELVGCALVLPVMIFMADISLSGGLMICGAFLLCACIGDAAALLLLLRFNAFTLLTAVE